MREKWLAYLLWLFTGMLGGHKFYLEKIGMGILYAVTGGIFGIGWFIDLFTLGMQVDNFNAKKLAYKGILGHNSFETSFSSAASTIVELKNDFLTSVKSPEKQILTLTKTTNFLTLKDVVSSTNLSIDEAELILKKMVDKGIAKVSEDYDGVSTYYFY